MAGADVITADGLSAAVSAARTFRLTCAVVTVAWLLAWLGQQPQRGAVALARHGAYVVRDAGESTGPANPDDLYPYTLRGLVAAIEDARLRSLDESAPQELVVIPAKGHGRVIRRYERGHEVPVSRLQSLFPGTRPAAGDFACKMAPWRPEMSGMEDQLTREVVLPVFK